MVTYHQFTREEFYDLVWSKPLSEIAPQFNLSDVALGKLCKRIDIPRPGVGYWAKLDAGKSVKKAALPVRPFGASQFVEFGNDPGVRLEATEQFLTQPLPDPPNFDEPMEAIKERAVVVAARVPIVKSLKNAHPSIEKLLKNDEKILQKRTEHRWGDLLYQPRFSTPFEKRRLKVLNSLVLALSHCGCQMTIQGTEARTLYARIGSVAIHYSLGIRAEVEDRRDRKHNNQSSDANLVLKIHQWFGAEDVQLEWQDRADLPLEDQIKEIVAGFLIAGETFYRLWQLHRHACEIERIDEFKIKVQKAREEEAQRELVLTARAKQEARRELIIEMKSWRRAEDIREYVRTKRKSVQEVGDAALIEQVDEWTKWALQEADAIDPLSGLNIKSNCSN